MEYLARAAASAAQVVEPGGTIVLMTDAQPTVGDGLAARRNSLGLPPHLRSCMRGRVPTI